MFPRQLYRFPQAGRNDYMAQGGVSEGCDCEQSQFLGLSLPQPNTEATLPVEVTEHVPSKSSPSREGGAARAHC
jgi:hypothetical protein